MTTFKIKAANRLQLNDVIKFGRKDVKITQLHYNSGSFGDYVTVYGIDVKKDLYIKPFDVAHKTFFEVYA